MATDTVSYIGRADAHNSMAPETQAFPQFSWLPKELREQIWDATMQSKLLTVIIGSNGESQVKSDVTQWSPHKNPVALGICTESRTRALLRYTIKVPIYRWHFLSIHKEARRYIDPEHDLVLVLPTADTVRRREYNFLEKTLEELLNRFLKKDVLDQKGKRRFAQVIERLAIPSRWWKDRFSGNAMQSFALTCFAIPREIYLIEEIDSEQQNGDAQVSECSGNMKPIMPDIKRRWQEPGWSVEYQEHAIKVVRPDSTIVYVRDLYHTSLAGIDLSAFEASETTIDTNFVRADPDQHYEERRDWRSGGRNASPWQHGEMVRQFIARKMSGNPAVYSPQRQPDV